MSAVPYTSGFLFRFAVFLLIFVTFHIEDDNNQYDRIGNRNQSCMPLILNIGFFILLSIRGELLKSVT